MQPQRIGPYEVERELGSGGMGTVYLARHQATQRPTAVKVLPASMSREPGFVARFNREIEALKAVTSPHIVELHESGVDGETYYYAMEYVEGETLTARLEREGRLPWREVIELSIQVCRALKSAHNAGVIHRDLKPSNLLITPDNQVKLTDFGVAQIFAGGKLTATGGVVGTAEFMAPEQAEGKRATRQSDIYALGAVMYIMLTGRPPFTGKTALDIAQKHRFGQFDSPRRFVPDIPSWLDEVVCKCLAKNPEHRYPDAYVLSLRLAEIPRKVDLARQSSDPLEGNADPTAETVAANLQSPGAPLPAGQVGGTFVRDMVRAELDRSAPQSAIEGWLDSTWVLVGLLAALIGGGVWLYQRRTIDPEELLASGEALMQSTDRQDWLEADRDYFAPLRALDPAWQQRIEPYAPRIALAEYEQEILNLLRRRDVAATPGSEPLRLLERIRRDLEAGDFGVARLRLTALLDILGEGQDHALERQMAADLLEQFPPVATSRENNLANGALVHADQLAAAGNIDGARRIWTGLIALYRDDAAALTIVEKAEQRLHANPAPQPD